MSDYTSIDCGLYSRYELAIMHHQKLRLAWREPNGAVHIEMVLPVDLQTRAQVEYLKARSLTGRNLEIRLDWIIRVEWL